jgi:hypothetical protein
MSLLTSHLKHVVDRTPEEQEKYNQLYLNLKKRLMKVYRQKKGDKVSLCPHLLKDLYDLISMELTKLERSSVSIYELQTYLIEVSVYPKDYYEGMKFESFFNWLINSIRCEPKLWIKSSPVYRKINKFLTD